MRDGRKKENRDHMRPNHLKGSIFTTFIAYTLLVRLKGSIHFYILLVWMRNSNPLTKWNLTIWAFPSGSAIKESACNAGDACLIPGLGRSHGRWHGNPLQYSCLENPMDRGAWWATIHRVTKSDTTEATEHSGTAKLHMNLFFDQATQFLRIWSEYALQQYKNIYAQECSLCSNFNKKYWEQSEWTK